jgi:hypothetical protein
MSRTHRSNHGVSDDGASNDRPRHHWQNRDTAVGQPDQDWNEGKISAMMAQPLPNRQPDMDEPVSGDGRETTWSGMYQQSATHKKGKRPAQEVGDSPSSDGAATEQDEIYMTGHRYVDVEACPSGPPTKDCPLDPSARIRDEQWAISEIHLFQGRMNTALEDLKDDVRWEAARERELINGALDAVMLGGIGLAGPAAHAVSHEMVALAPSVGEMGLTRTAWAMADGVSVEKLEKVLELAGERGRNAMHKVHLHEDQNRGGAEHQIGVLDQFRAGTDGMARSLIESLGGMKDAQREAFVDSISGPDTSVESLRGRFKRLLGEFVDCSIGDMGKKLDLFGGLELAKGVRIRLLNRTWTAKLRSFGADHSKDAQALTAANMHSKTKITMETLEFQAFVPGVLQDLAHNDMVKRQGEESMELWDFDGHANAGLRSETPWFNDMFHAALKVKQAGELDYYSTKVTDQSEEGEGKPDPMGMLDLAAGEEGGAE